ncbi:MAG: hypothetical protein RR554_00200 [Vagococcus sp.]|uniref:hypothetical protein n=1 Tax=Vagococcus sp. TaxID=1933889 RepID=UPI002FC6F9C5
MNDIEELVKVITQKVLEKLGEVGDFSESSSKEVKVYGETTKELEQFLLDYEYEKNSSIDNSEAIVLTQLSLDSLIKISKMLPSTSEEQEILNALLSKKTVYVLNSGKVYQTLLENSPFGAKQYVTDCEEQWVKYGAQFITIECQTLSKDVVPRLWTQEYLQKEKNKGVTQFNVPKGTIVTPLAKDYIREQQLLVNYAGKEE